MQDQKSSSGTILSNGSLNEISVSDSSADDQLASELNCLTTEKNTRHTTVVINDSWREHFMDLPVREELKLKLARLQKGTKVKLPFSLLLMLNRKMMKLKIEDNEKQA